MIFGTPEAFALEIVPDRFAETTYLICGNFCIWVSSHQVGSLETVGSLREVCYSLGLILAQAGLQDRVSDGILRRSVPLPMKVERVDSSESEINLNRFAFGEMWRWQLGAKVIGGDYEITVGEIESGLSEKFRLSKTTVETALVECALFLNTIVEKSNQNEGVHYGRRRYKFPLNNF